MDRCARCGQFLRVGIPITIRKQFVVGFRQKTPAEATQRRPDNI